MINKSPSGLSTEIVLVVKSSWHIETAELASECQQMEIKCQRQQSLGFAIHLYLRKKGKRQIATKLCSVEVQMMLHSFLRTGTATWLLGRDHIHFSHS